MKIDKETFEFQMRLIRAEMKVESLTEENERLKGYNESNGRQIKYLQERTETDAVEIRSLSEYISRFIKTIDRVAI